jgi:ribosomal-protein-alanine N-acetyltransferase
VAVPPLRTERLELRPLDPVADAAAMASLWADPDYGTYLLEPAPADPDEMSRRLAWVDDEPPGLGGWVTLTREDAAVVGRMSLRRWPHDPAGPPELGWYIAPRLWGRGLASEAMTAVLAHARDTLGLAQVVAIVREDNARSAALARRLGGRETGSGHWYGEDRAFTRFLLDLGEPPGPVR